MADKDEEVLEENEDQDDEFIEGSNPANKADLTEEETKNIGLLLDVKMPIHVKIGSKKMLVKDVVNMDIGSIIELEQLANEPLEVFVDNKMVAKGEVVIIDGNFGVQITHIGTRKERLMALRDFSS